LKRIWYHIIKIFISTGLFFFFKKILVNDPENIPKKGAVLLVSNHKNALLDPLLIATTTKRNIHFLTRASAFKVRPIKWLLSTVNMLPIYRLRDGKETLAKNEIIFNKRALSLFSSGEKKINLLFIYLSYIDMFLSYRGEYPVFLVDDYDIAMDEKNTERLISNYPEMQIIATSVRNNKNFETILKLSV